jgi:cyclopropane fatty-acyl-phospholipid synthase-like methyltransferase
VRPAAFSPACERNREPIRAVIEPVLTQIGARRVLEIGSGTGQHAVYFARAMPQLTWITSDRRENHPAIREWLAYASPDNVEGPLDLDVLAAFPALTAPVDAVFSANTAHIMSWEAVQAMFAGLPACLQPGGRLLLYGPFNREGRFTSESNAAFDASLRREDPAMGIRDLEAVEALAVSVGLQLRTVHGMPANNFLLDFAR